MSQKIAYARHDDIAVLRIENPPVNALSLAVREGLMGNRGTADSTGGQFDIDRHCRVTAGIENFPPMNVRPRATCFPSRWVHGSSSSCQCDDGAGRSRNTSPRCRTRGLAVRTPIAHFLRRSSRYTSVERDHVEAFKA